MMKPLLFSSGLLALSLTLGACGGTVATPQPIPMPTTGTNPAPVPAATNFITGRVTNLQGQPLKGARVVADNTLGYNSNLIAYSGADGQYRIDIGVLPVTWNVTAQLDLKYNGWDVPVQLKASSAEVVAGGPTGGGVRDFTFAPTVTAANPYGDLGKINVVHGFGQFGVKEADVTLTVTPDGPLADGSAGAPLTVKPVHTGDGWIVPNVMYGTYRVTATMNGVPLQLRPIVQDGTLAPWQDSFTGGFTWPYWATRPTMYLELGDGE